MGGTDQIHWQAALPAIRTRLEARHGDLDRVVVEMCVTRAIEDTSRARIQTYRAILVERRADGLLRHYGSTRAQSEGRKPDGDMDEQLGGNGVWSSDAIAESPISVAGGAR